MALSKIDVANMLTGVTPVANGGTALSSGFKNGVDPRPLSKPLIINGDMAVAQRGTSKTSASGYTTVDRFRNFQDDGVVTATQESLTSGNAYINGFANAFKLDVTTADSSVANDHLAGIQYKFEGQDLQVFKKGTSNAEKFTVAFWFKSTKTGTYICELEDEDNSRNNSQSYTVSSSDTWEHKVVNFPADTTGAFGDDNGNSLKINWFLNAGTDFTSGTLQTAWGSETSANRCVGQVNALDNTSNNIHITGVQLEVGEFSSTTLPPFQHEDFGDNKQRCARYYYKVAEHGADGLTNQTFGMGYYKHTDQWRILCYLPERPRTNPSLDSTSGTNFYINDIQGVDDTFNSVTLTRSNADIIQVVHNNSNVSGTTGEAGESVAVASGAYIAFDAEL
tara:strand:- start:251 stop:1429 length:1179 start_codon:yes stop_codon:yes gene_type:complete